MKILILIAISILIQAKTIWILETDDLMGKVSIEKHDVIITPYDLEIIIPRGITVIRCNNQRCVDYTIKSYKLFYNVEVVK